jgi:serine/threonine protein kinase
MSARVQGEVYRALDTRLEREVAVKVLPQAVANDPDALTRFEREARAVAALSHPNILAIHDVGREQGISFAVTELLEGETLRERLGVGALTPGKAVAYAAQLAEGLAAAHERGLVHRDLKPDNVFIMEDGRVKLLDFGIAGSIEPDDTGPEAVTLAHATQPGTVLGTPAYMSPEQVRGERADARSDLFAFGVVLYEMLSGHRAFDRGSVAETLSAVLRDEPAQLSGVAATIPSRLEQIVRRCFEKSPGERFQSARDLAFALSTALDGKDETAAAATPDKISVVVLPFANLSPDPDNEFLADGFTEEAISDLSAIRSLKVI